MEEIDKKRFAELMAGLAQIFTSDISPRDLEAYWQLLKRYPLSQVEQAIINYCTSSSAHKFMPKPGEIIADLRGKDNELSLLAWVKVTKAIRQVGGAKTIIFDDAIIHAVITDLGGWIRLCRLTEQELNFHRREFERLYSCYLNRPPHHYPRLLAGIIDTTNAAAGYSVRENPILLGDHKLAALVYKNGQSNVGLQAYPFPIKAILDLSDTKNSLLSNAPIEKFELIDRDKMGEEDDN